MDYDLTMHYYHYYPRNNWLKIYFDFNFNNPFDRSKHPVTSLVNYNHPPPDYTNNEPQLNAARTLGDPSPDDDPWCLKPRLFFRTTITRDQHDFGERPKPNIRPLRLPRGTTSGRVGSGNRQNRASHVAKGSFMLQDVILRGSPTPELELKQIKFRPSAIINVLPNHVVFAPTRAAFHYRGVGGVGSL